MPPRQPAPLVTVAIPTVSRIDYLRDALTSVASQVYRPFEVLISENSGEASYGAAVADLCKQFPQMEIRIVHQTTQLSMPDNANALLAAARGVYWIYLPDDDRLGSTCISRSVAVLEEHSDAAFSFSDHWVMRSDGTRDEALSLTLSARYGRDALASGYHGAAELPALAARQVFHLQSMVLRLSAVGRSAFDPRDTVAPDLGLQFQLATDPAIRGAVFISERLVDYRVHVAQFTRASSSSARARGFVETVERFEGTVLTRYPAYRAILGRGYLELGSRELEAGRRLQAASALLRSARIRLTVEAAGKLGLVFLPHRAARGVLDVHRRLRGRS